MTTTSTAPAIPTVPTIHLNGTGATTLYKEYRAAYRAIDKAIDALCDTTLNGRDFYPQGADAFYRARDERQVAIEKLRNARQYCLGILEGIADQSPDCYKM